MSKKVHGKKSGEPVGLPTEEAMQNFLTRPLPPRLETWEDADAAMAQLCALQGQIDQIDTSLAGALQILEEDALKFTANAATQREPLATQSALLTKQIESFAFRNRAQLGNTKTFKRPFGSISFKLGKPSVAYDRDEKDIIEALENAKRGDCVEVTKVIRKEVAATLGEKLMATLGIRLKVPNESIEIKPVGFVKAMMNAANKAAKKDAEAVVS